MIKDDLKILNTLTLNVINHLKMTFGEELTNDSGEIIEINDSFKREILSNFIKPNYSRVGFVFVVYLIQRLELEKKSKEYISIFHILQMYLEDDTYIDTRYRLLKSFEKSENEFILTYYEIEEYSYSMKECSFLLDCDDYNKFLRKEKLKEIIK